MDSVTFLSTLGPRYIEPVLKLVFLKGAVSHLKESHQRILQGLVWSIQTFQYNNISSTGASLFKVDQPRGNSFAKEHHRYFLA